MRSGIVIKPRCIQGQPIYSGYFELSGCSMIGQAWATSIAVAISFDNPILYLKSTMFSFSDDDDDVVGGWQRWRQSVCVVICVVLMFPGGGRSSVSLQVFVWIGWSTMALSVHLSNCGTFARPWMWFKCHNFKLCNKWGDLLYCFEFDVAGFIEYNGPFGWAKLCEHHTFWNMFSLNLSNMNSINSIVTH